MVISCWANELHQDTISRLSVSWFQTLWEVQAVDRKIATAPYARMQHWEGCARANRVCWGWAGKAQKGTGMTSRTWFESSNDTRVVPSRGRGLNDIGPWAVAFSRSYHCHPKGVSRLEACHERRSSARTENSLLARFWSDINGACAWGSIWVTK